MRWEARVFITLKPGVLDPQGKAVQQALEAMDYQRVGDVRVGKFIVLDVEAGSSDEAAVRVDGMCRELLANPVIEQYRVDLIKGGAA